ncbi:MAG: carbohydrate ABC transporter permease [SAR324 cluster bacterium]|nr:carbohydrate ABC transporter permease [SAR324 cluster bacterium]
MIRRKFSKFLSILGFYLLLGIITIYALFPFYYAFISSFKSGTEIFIVNYLPTKISFDNYLSVLKTGYFGQNILNSAFVAFSVVLISMMLGIFASYSLARLNFKGRSTILLVILSASMFPQVAVLSGMFELVAALSLFNSLWSLVLTYMIFTIPFTVWILHTFMKAFPPELERAALIDGATTMQLIFKVILPIMWPALVSVGLLSFIAAWNEFLFALTFISSDHLRTVPVAIATLSGASEHEIPWGNIMAASMIITIPLIMLVVIFQNRIVSGLTAGAVKG